MLICPACKTTIDDAAGASGVCPKCGQALAAGGPATKPPLAATLEATSALMPMIAQGPRVGRGSHHPPAVTQDLPPTEKRHTVSIPARKLSAENVEMITNTWGQVARGEPNSRSSLKFDSKTSSGMGSSLVVNPRGVRNVEAMPHIPSGMQAAAGADYELLQVIGKGGMGVVYSARQASVDRMVAVKMIRPNAAADAAQREKFLSEAVVTGDLDHPNIVPIYELGSDENNALFYSMKRVQGTPWADVLSEKSLSENLEILMKVADAVAFAHSNGVVHRDLKPENVMLGEFGEVLVMDWGLALATTAFRHAEFVTGNESMGGTPAYMAPEMITGPFEIIGPPCDIYLLGALLFECVTGLRPHHGETTEECLFAAARNEIQPTEESGELVEIAYHAMATEPTDRFASVQEFQAAIRDYNSHCESISLAARADHELGEAGETGDYQIFARAVFGFQEALTMWDGNTRAEAGILEARLAYAHCAKTKGDYELGISLLDADNPDHAALRADLAAAQRERSARQKWLSRFKRIAAALVVIVFGVITAALYVVADAKNQETAAKDQAIQDKIRAEDARKEALAARQQEEVQKNKAIASEQQARESEKKARSAEEEERLQKTKAIAAENKARSAEQEALRAKQGEEYAAYVARIGMAAAKIEENAFDAAQNLLAACQPKEGEDDLRNWEWGHLKRLAHQGINFKATGTVKSVAFSPDGKWFVTAGDDGQAHIWDHATRKHRLSIKHGAAIEAVAISPDGQYVATAGDDRAVRIFRAKDGSPLHTLEGHANRVLDVAFSPRDGRWLISCSRDKTAIVWDTTTGKKVTEPLREHTWWVWSAAFSPDETRIATAGEDGKVIVWSFEPHKSAITKQTVFLGHVGPVFAVAFSPDGQHVASGGYDRRVLVWQPDKTKDVDLKQLVAINDPITPQESRSFEGHSAPVRSLVFSVDGRTVLSAGDDNTVRIWDTMAGRLRTVLRGHSRPVQSCAFSPDGRQVLSGGQEGQIKLWNILDDKEMRASEGRILEGHSDAILSAAFSRDGRRIVTASRDHSARVYDSQKGDCIASLKEGHDFLTSRARFFQGGKRLLTAGGDNSVRIWDVASGAEVGSIEGTGRTAAVAVSRDSKWVLTGKPWTSKTKNQPSDRKADVTAQAGDESLPQIALWDLDASGKSARPHAFADGQFGAGHRAIVTAVAISPDQRWLFSGDDAGIGKLWDAATGKEVVSLKGHTSGITDAMFLPDSRRMVTSSNDGTVTQWEVPSGKQLRGVLAVADPNHRDAHDAPVTAMALSPDGRQALTLSEDTEGVVRQSVIGLWNLDQAKLIHQLYRGPEGVTSVAFADGGHAAISASTVRDSGAADAQGSGGMVRRWNLETGREIAAAGGGPFLDFRTRRDVVWSAIEAPSEAAVLTVGGNGASLWNPRSPGTPELVFKPHGGVTSAGFSPSGKLIVTGSSDRRVKIWNAATGQVEIQLPAEHSQPVTSAVFSPVDKDERLLLTASEDGTARIWDSSARRELRVLKHHEAKGPIKAVRAAIFSPDGKNVLTACEDATARIWDAASGRPIATLKLDGPALCVAYSADGRRIIVGDANGGAMTFDAQTHRPLVRYLGHTDAINSVAFSPDGLRALTGSADRSAKIWDTVEQDSLADSAQPTAEIKTADSNEPRDGTEILTLKHHDRGVTSVAFSPDGHAVLTTGLDGTAVLWLTEDWQKPLAKK